MVTLLMISPIPGPGEWLPGVRQPPIEPEQDQGVHGVRDLGRGRAEGDQGEGGRGQREAIGHRVKCAGSSKSGHEQVERGWIEKVATASGEIGGC